MSLATGIFNINSGNPAELNTRSFAGQILRRFPNGAAPMFALSSQVGRSKAKQSTHGYFTKVMSFHVLTQAANALAAATNLQVDSTAGMTAKMVLYNTRTGENARVTAVVDATNVTLTRGFGRIAAADSVISDVWIQIGTAFEEGSNRPSARRITTAYIPNYTQIFRNAWAMTDTARASYAEMGISNIQENRNDCALFHSTDIESGIIWGQPLMDTSGSTPVHTTQGVIDAITQYSPSNVQTAASTTNFDQLVDLVEPAFEYSTNLGDPKSRIAYCDKIALKVLNQIGRLSGQVTVMQAETSFGMRFTKFEFYKGTINLIEHPLLNGLQREGMMLIMDMSALKLAYLDGRDTKTETYGQGQNADSGEDAVGGSLLSELAVELINPFSCEIVNGLEQGVA
jgi:hypothetical protein